MTAQRVALDCGTETVDCSCGWHHKASYVLTRCGHPGCEVIGCGQCLTRCEGDQWRCEMHFFSEVIPVTTPNGVRMTVAFYTFADWKQMLEDEVSA